MDKIYKFYDRRASPNIHLDDYFRRYGEALESWNRREKTASTEEDVFRLMDVDVSRARTRLMPYYCSIDNLALPMETADSKKREHCRLVDIPERIVRDTSLETIRALKELPEDAFSKPKSHNNGVSIKYEESEFSGKEDTVIPNRDFLVYVRIYEPFNSQWSVSKHGINQGPPFLKLKNVVSILGRQSLYDLRRKISCQSDLSIATEISATPRRRHGPMAEEVYKSGFFYIGDTFYNDTGSPNNLDYSRVIIQWAEKRDIGPFKIATMDARIGSLCAKFGFPWVYQHQGRCEHVVVLSDARLVTETDASTLSVYPRIERMRATTGRNCIMCGMLNVRWILTDHDRIPHDTSYFCNKCFLSYNYVNGKKIGSFKAYRYPCVTELMP